MDTVLYFAYGSNLKQKRLHINCPSAELVCVAKLVDYKLIFAGEDSVRWHGAPSTIVKCVGDIVWGAVWRLNREHLLPLDRQEGVHLCVYQRIEVDVETMEGVNMKCVSYKRQDDVKENLPSHLYLRIIMEGAEEVGLPETYREQLKDMKHNGYHGDINFLEGTNI